MASPSCGDVGGCPGPYWTLDTMLWSSSWGKWREVTFSNPFPSPWQHDIYSGAPRWFTREYTNDTAANGWIDRTRARWSDWWTEGTNWLPWIGGRGPVSAGYDRGFYPGSGYRTYIHRRWFNVTFPSGKVVKSARLYAWVDTTGCFWINNNPVGSGCTGSANPGVTNGWQPGGSTYGWKWIDIPASWIYSGANLLAADVRNLETFDSPFGLQYELHVTFDYPPPTACITSISPASWQNADTNVNVTVQASAQYGVSHVGMYLCPDSACSRWWTFADFFPANPTSVTLTGTINWSQAPSWMPPTGVLYIRAQARDSAGQLRGWQDTPCLRATYEWVDPRPPSVTITALYMDRTVSNPGSGSNWFTNDTTISLAGTTTDYSGHGISRTEESHSGSISGSTWSVGTTSWSYSAPGFSGRTRFSFRGWDALGRAGNWAWVDVYVEDRPSVAPAAPSATAVSTSRIDLSWSIPLDRGAGGVANGSTEAYGNNYYRAGNVGVQVYRGSTVIRDWTTATSMSDTGLSPNTQYTYKLYARDNNGGTRGPWHNYVWGNTVSRYTLPQSPAVTCNRATNSAYTTNGFAFTSSRTFGAGGVSHYHYKWNTNSTDTPTQADPVWSGGTLNLTASSYGRWYLHLTSHNPEHASGGSVTYGPYVFSDYPTTNITRVDVDSRQIANPARGAAIFTNDTTAVIRGSATAVVGSISAMQEYHWGSLGNTSWAQIATGGSFVHSPAAFSGHTRFHYRAVDSYGLAPSSSSYWGWVDIYVDDLSPVAPAAPSATAVSTSRIDLSWSIPLDRGSGGVGAGATEAYSAVYGGANYYRAGNVAAQVYRGSTLIRDWTTATSMSDTGLSANTQYTYKLYARDNNGETRGPWHNYTWGSAVARYTLPQSPAATCDKPTGVPQGNANFTFTSSPVFGAGGVDHYHYRWNTSPTSTPTQADPVWSGGTLTLTAQPGQDYYLHLVSHNPEHASGGTMTYGPYFYGPPPEVLVDSLELDRAIASPGSGSTWYTNDTTPVVRGRVETVVGLQRVEGNTGSGWSTVASASPFVWSLSGLEGQAVLQLRAVDTAEQMGQVYTLAVYIDPRAPQEPALQATASGQGRILLTWATPLDQGGRSIGQGSSRYVGSQGYRAADVATRLEGLTGWGTATSFAHEGLAPNTPRSYVLQARDNNAESDGPWHNQTQAGASRWTLAEPPQVVADRETGVVYMTPEFRFWNASPWGLGHVDHMHYAFTASPSHAFSGNEPVWSSGELFLVAPAYGTYYLHLLSHNPEHAWDGSNQAAFGPHLYASPELTLAAEYSHLILMGPDLALPAQVLRGTLAAGGQPQEGWEVEIVLERPDRQQEVYTAVTGPDGSFVLDAGSSGNQHLGCDEVGDWLDWARLLGVESEAVTWVVEWFEVHGSG